jgi:hypothetical protein
MTWIQKSPEYTLEYFSKVHELVSILICDLEKSKQANLAKNPLGGTGVGEALAPESTGKGFFGGQNFTLRVSIVRLLKHEHHHMQYLLVTMKFLIFGLC